MRQLLPSPGHNLNGPETLHQCLGPARLCGVACSGPGGTDSCLVYHSIPAGLGTAVIRRGLIAPPTTAGLPGGCSGGIIFILKHHPPSLLTSIDPKGQINPSPC